MGGLVGGLEIKSTFDFANIYFFLIKINDFVVVKLISHYLDCFFEINFENLIF